MTAIIPIIVPVDTTPETCPKCGKVEDKVTTCRHCKHEYKGGDTRWYHTLIAVMVIILFVLTVIWGFFTMLEWLFDPFEKNSLLEVVRGQWEWLRGIRIW